MTKLLKSVVLMALVPVSLSACSVVSCIGRGVELRRDFTVLVKHEGKPLRGVTVNILSNGTAVRFSAETAPNGIVHVKGLPPGDYWISADLLGINAAYQCFHVADRASRKAQDRMTYEWGDFPYPTRRLAGRLSDSQPGTGDSPLWNLVNRRTVPIRGAQLTLHKPTASAVYSAISDQDGSFAIEHVPAGIYVLHIEGGTTGRNYDATDLLVRVSPRAREDKLLLVRSEGGAGSCGATSLRIDNTQASLTR